MNIVIIGAGISGLAAAIRLKVLGHEVYVYESASAPGGKIKEHSWNDFRFDTGPSLFTLPALADDLFILSGKDPREYFNYLKLETVTKYFYSDGIIIDSFSDPELFANEIEKKLSIRECVILKFLSKQAKTYKLLAPIFLENPIHLLFKLFKVKNIPALLHLADPYFLKKMDNANQKSFENEPHIIKIFNRYGTYNGSNPYKMPSLFNIISHLEHNEGAFLPEKGMSQLVKAIFNLATEIGVNFKFNSYVDEILIENGAATGIRSFGKIFKADYVVSNMDVNNTFSKLLPKQKAPQFYLKNEKSTSALIFQWAIDKSFPMLDVHNILFADNYKSEFNHLFEMKCLYSDPTVYIYISSKIIKGDAPEGKENWFVMINTPHLSGKEEEKYWKEKGRGFIVEKIKTILKIDIEKYILHENCITPQILEETTNSYLGSLYGASSNSMLSAFMRHPNFSKIKRLYFCGGTVHPGGGIPLCLLSAKITSGLINESVKKG